MLPAIARMLIDQVPGAVVADLRKHYVVLPTSRACRRLAALLDGARGDRPLYPPRILTGGALVQQCLPPRRTQASDLMVSIAWQHVLAKADESDCRALAGHKEAIAERERASLACRLQSIVRELATAGTTPTEVAGRIAADHLPMSTSIWFAIDRMRRAMLATLDSAGLDEPETARAAALAAGDVFVDELTHLWVVAADPSPRERALLQAIDAKGVSVTSLVHGDEKILADAFTDSGIINHDWWTAAQLPMDTDSIRTCDGVPDQVAVVLECLADAGEDVDPTDVCIVVPDPTLGPLLQRLTRAEQVHVHLAEGRSASRGRIGSLLVAVHACLVSNDASTWGDLLRHPDIERLAGNDALVAWDALWAKHLPRDLSLPPSGGRAEFDALFVEVRKALAPLLGDTAAPASAWAAPIAEVLLAIVSDGAFGTDDDVSVLTMVQSHLQALHEMPAGAISVPAHAVIGALVQVLQDASMPAQRHPDAIDCVGWLDAHLDDASLCIITGMNEGTVPAAPSTDPWLPEGLRAAIGLSTAQQRFARDAWLMHAVVQSGRRVELIMPRRGAEGDPLLPSRLLLGARGEALAHRTLALIKPQGIEPSLTSRQPSAGAVCSFDGVQLPDGNPVIEGMSVTSFKTYLTDPLAFLLRQDRRIRSRDVCVQGDLDHRGFGDYLHRAVEAWGNLERNRDVPTTDVDVIERELLESLDTLTDSKFGNRPRPGVRLQHAIAGHRLRVFAQHQASHAKLGWKVKYIEQSWGMHPRDDAPSLHLGSGAGLSLSGRIDRIDEHPEYGWMAIDYKTGTRAIDPDKAHRDKSGEWLDLQLPLYAALMASSGMYVEGHRLGYVLLAPAVDTAGFAMAHFSNDDLAVAKAEAEAIVDVIQSGDLMQTVEDWCNQ